MSEKLKPCPFCGSRDIEVVRYGTNRVSCIVQCEDCGCKLESNEIGHGDAWNMRQCTSFSSELERLRYVETDHWCTYGDIEFSECEHYKNYLDQIARTGE